QEIRNENAPAHTDWQLLIWESAGELFASRAEDCREVDLDANVVPVPHAPDHLSGIVTLRGDVVTVLNLNRMLGRPGPATRSAAPVIVRFRVAGNDVVIIGDSIRDIIHVPQKSVQPVPLQFSELERKHISAVA